MEQRLKGKVAVVTGGGGILCSAFAKELARQGAKVAILDLRLEAAKKVADEINSTGAQAIGIACDVLDIESVKTAEEEVTKAFGEYDILINGAGGNHPKGCTTNEYMDPSDINNTDEDITTFFDLDPKGFDFVFSLNFMGTLIPTQVFSKKLVGKEGSTIINISSMSGYAPLTKVPAYSGAKAAIINFTQWLAVHMSKVGIRVNAISPGFFLTDQNRTLLTNPDGSLTPRSAKILSQTPMERFGEPEDLLGTLVFLADNKASSFITGVVIPVDGGFMAYSGV